MRTNYDTDTEIFSILAVISWSGIQTQFPLTQKPVFIMTVICDFLGTAKLIHLLSLFSSKMCWFVLLWGENNHFMTFILSGIKVLFSDFHNGAAPSMTKKANVGISFCSCLQWIPPELICSSRVACLPVFGSFSGHFQSEQPVGSGKTVSYSLVCVSPHQCPMMKRNTSSSRLCGISSSCFTLFHYYLGMYWYRIAF